MRGSGGLKRLPGTPLKLSFHSADETLIFFLEKPMNSAATARSSPTPTPDRRRHKRFRLSMPVSISGSDASIIPAMTLEVSEGGLSAVLVCDLQIGDTVKIYPIGGETLTAQVRHRVGKVYGFEFLEVSGQQVCWLRDTCSSLPRYPDNNKMGI